jgi:hypothetical protein
LRSCPQSGESAGGGLCTLGPLFSVVELVVVAAVQCPAFLCTGSRSDGPIRGTVFYTWFLFCVHCALKGNI